MNKARSYTDKTLKRLFALSGNQCAFPGCSKKLVNEKNAKDSNICHIEAASPGGERYDKDMSDEERADYSNLILLCVQHHDETNDVDKYTVSALREMKQNHERQFLQETLRNNPSMLVNIISAIASFDFNLDSQDQSLNSFDPKEKISHNKIKINEFLINECKAYHSKINALYNELERQGSLKKEKVLTTINHIYLKLKGQYTNANESEIESVRKHSDAIIEGVRDELRVKLEGSGLWTEDVELGINLVIVDAFMRCKILEKPE